MVHEKTVDLCQLGLKDRIPGEPHKKSTLVQMNHPVIETPAFSEKRCSCAPRAHQPIEGSVALTDPLTGTWRSVKRSALASEWTPQFCGWLLDGLQRALDETSIPDEDFYQPVKQLHRRNPRFFETVPVEVEATPEGQLRQHMQINDYGTRYDYIHFDSEVALLNKTVRSTMAHLHVALGHVSNDKLKRMLSMNGAKPENLWAVDRLQFQICNQVRSPAATPKGTPDLCLSMSASWRIHSTFGMRLGEKFCVTHILDAFSLYQVAVAAKDPSSELTTNLLRDRWIGVFGPPAVLMTDQGSEFKGTVGPLLQTFAIFHEIFPPTAPCHWQNDMVQFEVHFDEDDEGTNHPRS